MSKHILTRTGSSAVTDFDFEKIDRSAVGSPPEILKEEH